MVYMVMKFGVMMIYNDIKNIKHGESQKKYYLKNSEKIKEYSRKYYLKNSKKIKESQKKYKQNNKEKGKEYQKKYRENHRDIVAKEIMIIMKERKKG